jgi:UDP-N-acetyl-D-mannosaminuronic acid dehydrogenase
MQKRIIVVGTGYVGLPAALMWARAGMDVIGVDIDENVVRAINEGILHINAEELQHLLEDPVVRQNLVARGKPCEGDVFVIAVPTPIDPLRKICDMSAVNSAIESIAPYLREGNLVIVESTIPPMTCTTVIKPLIEKLTGLSVPRQIMLAHCPERILPGDIFREIVENERLIGGLDERSTAEALSTYESFVIGKLHRTDALSAELSKLMENAYRDINIALANEFSQICEHLGADVQKVIGFANRHPRVKILTPGIGVGGHCIPVDPWFLKEVAPYNSRLIATARIINDEMPLLVASKIRRSISEIADPTIVAIGATYKKNCPDVRESPAIEIVRHLRKDGYRVRHFDKNVRGLEYTTLSEVATGADLMVVLVGHKEVLKDLNENRSAIEAAMLKPKIMVFGE